MAPEERKLKRVSIKEEFVALTGDHVKAVILAQFEYWQSRVNDFDKFIGEEKARAAAEGEDVVINETHGWIYKDAEELSKETMLGLARNSMLRHIKALVDEGYLLRRPNPHYRWDKTYQYRLNLQKIADDLEKIGYSLQNWVLPAKRERIDMEHRDSKMEARESKTELRASDVEARSEQNGTAIPEITPETTIRESLIDRSGDVPTDGLIEEGKIWTEIAEEAGRIPAREITDEALNLAHELRRLVDLEHADAARLSELYRRKGQEALLLRKAKDAEGRKLRTPWPYLLTSLARARDRSEPELTERMSSREQPDYRNTPAPKPLPTPRPDPEATKVWDQVLKDLHDEIDTPSWRVWFEGTVPTGLEKDTLTLTVPNDFAEEYIGERFKPSVEASLAEHLSSPSARLLLVVLGCEHESV